MERAEQDSGGYMSLMFWKSPMFHEMKKAQKFAFLVSRVLFSLLLVTCALNAQSFFLEGISVDALAAWMFGLTTVLLLERHLLPFVNHQFNRLALTLVVAGAVALIGNELQNGDIPLMGFPNRWTYVGVAFIMFIHLFPGNPVARTGRRRRRRWNQKQNRT